MDYGGQLLAILGAAMLDREDQDRRVCLWLTRINRSKMSERADRPALIEDGEGYRAPESSGS